jgi:hypothetical protein
MKNAQRREDMLAFGGLPDLRLVSVTGKPDEIFGHLHAHNSARQTESDTLGFSASGVYDTIRRSEPKHR